MIIRGFYPSRVALNILLFERSYSVLNIKKSAPLVALNILLFERSYSVLNIKKSAPLFAAKIIFLQSTFYFYRNTMDLSNVIKSFENVVPKHFAEKWDNTGLLVDSAQKATISTIFFTNDLTEDVLKEACSAKANLIISYHPPLFAAFKALRDGNWKDRIIMKCIVNNIAIYSPHTACDAVEGGVNDWLIKCFDIADVEPIRHSSEMSSCIECIAQDDISFDSLLEKGVEFTILTKSSYEDKKCYKILANLPHSATVFQALLSNPAVLTVSNNQCRNPKYYEMTGMGRKGKLQKPLKLGDCIQLVKSHLKLKNIRFALGVDCTFDTEVTTIAVCAGSGASLLKDATADLYITGEMSHHELLDAIHKKTSVILCEHSNSERGYLVELVDQLRPIMKGVNLVISKVDKDPISIV